MTMSRESSAGALGTLAPRAAAAPVATARLVRRRGPVPRWWRDASVAGGWLVLLMVTALWVKGGGIQQLTSVSDALMSTGRLTGLIASALLLIQVFLMARVPWVEQAWGQDELARTHRLVGFTSFNLMLAHIVLITLGYAAGTSAGIVGTFVDLVLHYPGMLLALAGTAALVMVVVTSVKKARKRLRYESWHLIHLYGYLGAGLALPHQLWTGTDFLSSTTATVFWWTLYAVCAGAVLVFRVGLPLWRSLRSPLRVLDVRAEGPGVTTVTVGGGGVRRMPVRAGQFFQWRFLDGPGWTRGNPYSISAAPDGRTLRFTAAHVGHGSERLATLRPGTRVLVEGPYGRMHAGVRARRKVLLMGSGIGITPMRALLEELDQAPGDVTVVHRVRSRHDAVLVDELASLAAARGARYLLVEGPRVPDRDSWLPAQARHLSDVQALREIVPDIEHHDVYVCGSDGWMSAARSAAIDAGVPHDAVHLERFAY
jgi:ferredoxin-NADP reductase/DMSO/TMAO reductase YedYZ heme-binding membrane subunit